MAVDGVGVAVEEEAMKVEEEVVVMARVGVVELVVEAEVVGMMVIGGEEEEVVGRVGEIMIEGKVLMVEDIEVGFREVVKEEEEVLRT